MFRRFNLKTEIMLATIPAAMIIAVLVLLETFSKQQLLFSSLASSAFLIYLDPRHPVNSIRTLVIAQISAAIIGFLVYLLLGPGYLAATLSMIIAVSVMILANAMHPPAVSSALLFAFQYSRPNTLMLFVLAVLLLVILIVLQRVSIWIIKKDEKNKLKEHERLGGIHNKTP
jgi:CBS-domain-containing membrane protein